MPTESQATEARQLLTQHVVELEDVDKEINDLVVYRDQQVQSVLEEHKAALIAIEEQKKTRMEAIQKRWKEKMGPLQTKRGRIQASSDEQRFILAPVRKLPLELLVNIFEHFVCEDGSPWTLALVSVAWSNVMFSTCSLWSTVHVDINPRSANLSLKRLKAHLRRAGTRHLLDVHLAFNTKLRTNKLLNACELIGGRDMLARWRSVTLINTPVTLTQEQLEPLFAHPLPNLRSLSVESRRSDMFFNVINELIDSNILFKVLLKSIDTSAKALRILSVDQHILVKFRDYPNTLRRVEVLRCSGDSSSCGPLSEVFPLMRALNEVELPGYILEHCQTQDWLRSVETATFHELPTRSTTLFDPRKEYLLNLRQLSLIDCPRFYSQRPWIKTPNLRVLKVVGDLKFASFFDTPILDDLCLIGHEPTLTTRLGEHEEALRYLYDNPFGAPKIRHLRLETMVPAAETIEFLKKVPWLERLTIQESPRIRLSYDLFAALKQVVEDVVHSDGPPQGEMAIRPAFQNLRIPRFTSQSDLPEWITEAVAVRSNPPPQGKMAMCPTLQNLTIKALSAASQPDLSEWVTEVVTVRRNLGETFKGIVF